MDLSTADRMMIQVPMFHCFGMVLSMTASMTHGATMCPLADFCGGPEGDEPGGHVCGPDGHLVSAFDPQCDEGPGKLVHIVPELGVGPGVGEGALPMRELMNALGSVNYDGFISLIWDPAWMEGLDDAEMIRLSPHTVWITT